MAYVAYYLVLTDQRGGKKLWSSVSWKGLLLLGNVPFQFSLTDGHILSMEHEHSCKVSLELEIKLPANGVANVVDLTEGPRTTG